MRISHHMLPVILLGLAIATVTVATAAAWPSHERTLASADVRNVCGYSTPPLKYDHVIWILEENRSLQGVIGTSSAPFITSLSRQCAYTTNFTDNEPRQNLGPGYHSLSHYLADTSGSNCLHGNGRFGTKCVYADYRAPSRNMLATMSIFQQVELAGGTWKSYQESAPSNCSLQSSGKYVFRHDAAVYYSNLRGSCLAHDVPIPALAGDVPQGALIDDIHHNSLPAFAYITPNLDHDMHNGSVAEGDAWLETYLVPLFHSQTWKEGRTAVFVVWDEAASSQDTLPNLAIAPSAHGGASAITANGFAVLRSTEQMLGLPFLGCANGAPPGEVGRCYPGATADLRTAFNL